MTIGEKIRIIRKRKSIDQGELAALAKVRPATVSLIENGKTKPDLSTLMSIATALEVSLDELTSDLDLENPKKFGLAESAADYSVKVPKENWLTPEVAVHLIRTFKVEYSMADADGKKKILDGIKATFSHRTAEKFIEYVIS